MKTYAIVGTGGRALMMFGEPLVREFPSQARLVGACDPNLVRAKLFSHRCGGPPVFEDFDAMLDAVHADTVIVTTVDASHHQYIIRAMERGCDVICEKPLTIDRAKAAAIVEARRRTGRGITLAFNMRFMPYMARIREILADGALGEVLSVDLAWMLDRRHGADYFRRWHRQLRNSGGLLVHKATHHFDAVNWWVDDIPAEVFARGTRRVYGDQGPWRAERCTGCPHRGECPYFWDMSAVAFDRELYAECESADGYFRDSCVFAPEIDIYDTMSLSVRYARGALLTYSLVAYAPYEGFRVTVTGRDGRLEAEEFLSGPRTAEPEGLITVHSPSGATRTTRVPRTSAVHGGGDERLRAMIFGDIHDDPLGQKAGLEEGLRSLMVGAGANESIAAGRPVNLAEEWKGVLST